MGIPFLSKPLNIYKDSYISALEEFQKEGLNLKYDKSDLISDFDKFISQINELETNPKTENGRVKESTYWLIDNNEYIGRISIRHCLTPYLEKYDGNIGFEIKPSKRKKGYGKLILELGIKEAQKIGLTKAFIMCKDKNISSIKIIEANNGILLERYNLKIEGKMYTIRKYIIVLKHFSSINVLIN